MNIWTLRVRKLLWALRCAEARRALLTERVLAASEHVTALSNINPGFVVDVGANRGQFALVACEVFPAAPLFAFEPLPIAAAVFRRVFCNVSRVVLHKVALGDREWTAPFHVTRADDSSSVLAPGVKQIAEFPESSVASRIEVLVKPLSEYASEFPRNARGLLKIDVQGYEGSVLAGASDCLEFFDWVYVECSLSELYEGQDLAGVVVNKLLGAGFGLRSISNPYVDKQGRILQADLLFAR